MPKDKYKPSKAEIYRDKGSKVAGELGSYESRLKTGKGPSGAARLQRLDKKYGEKAVNESIGRARAIGVLKQIDDKVAKGIKMQTTLDKKKKKKNK